MSKLITITRKIELRVNTDDKIEKNSHYEKLKAWRNIAVEIANMFISILYVGLKGENITYLEKKLDAIRNRPVGFDDMPYKEQSALSKEEDKPIYSAIEADKKEAFALKEAAYYYKLLSDKYKGTIKTAILSAVTTQVTKDFRNDKKKYLLFTQSLRTYKHNSPMPITADSIRKVRRSINNDTNKEYRDFNFDLFGIPLRTHFGKDLSGNYSLMNRAFSAWFLPDWIWDSEAILSGNILHMRNFHPGKDTVVYYLENAAASITYHELPEKDGDGDYKNHEKKHYYKINIEHNEKQYDFKMRAMKPKKVEGTDTKEILGYKIASDIKLCDSEIQLTRELYINEFGKKIERTKIFLHAVLQFEEKSKILDDNMAAYVELDPEVPLKVTIGTKVITIGSKEELQYRSLGIQFKFRETQRTLKFTNGGHGRRQKMKALKQFKSYEKDVIKSKIHLYSSELIKICLKYSVKHIFLRIPKEPKDNKTEEEKFLIRNWRYGQMQTSIEYKAGREEMEVSTVQENDSE